jgi:hypothetical protein
MDNLQIGDQYRIPNIGVVVEVTDINGTWMWFTPVFIPEPRTGGHVWSMGQKAQSDTTWFNRYDCEKLPNKALVFQDIYDKLAN